MPGTGVVDLTYSDPKIRHYGFDHPQNVESAAAHVSEEKHDPNAAAKLRTQGSADHVWKP